MDLFRTKEQIKRIRHKNSSPGGRSFTIIKNSSSLNIHETWVANQMAWRNKEAASELRKHPEMIEMGKSLIKLKRAIKNAKRTCKSN